MKAMALPSGDQRGRAIWRPWRGPEISEGERMTAGLVSHPSPPPLVATDGEGWGTRRLVRWGTRRFVGWGNLRESGWSTDGLGVQLGDPPVVFAGRIGGDVGEGLGIGRPIELVNVKAGGGEKSGRGGLSGGDGNSGDALDINAIFADDAGRRVHGSEGSGGTGSALDIKEGDALAVGREGRRIDVAVELGKTLGRIAVETREIKVGLAAEVGAIGEEGDGGRVGRPDGGGFRAGVAGRGRGGDALALVETAERSDVDFSAFDPGETLAVGRNGDLAYGLNGRLAGRGGRVAEAEFWTQAGRRVIAQRKRAKAAQRALRGEKYIARMLSAERQGARERGSEKAGSKGAREQVGGLAGSRALARRFAGWRVRGVEPGGKRAPGGA